MISSSLLLIALALGIKPHVAGATQWKTLDYLYSIQGKGTVVGVHNKISKTPSSFTDKAIKVSGKTPGLWGGDFLFDAESIENRWGMVQEAKKQWDDGAVISIMWHACNPTLHEPCTWSNHCHGDGPWSGRMHDDKWNDLITEGTALYNRWVEMMDDIAQYLEWLKAEAVEVLFRPLHEMNQGCFWWGGRPGPEGTRRLYQITHDYLFHNKSLTNLIWTWNIQDFVTLPSDADDYNPGDEYWEVATLDVYEGFTRQKYDVMVGVAGNKPIAIGECWELPTADRLSEESRWSFFMSWSELTFQWPNTISKLRNLYNSEEVITLGDMPGWTKASVSGSSNQSATGWALDFSDRGIVIDLASDHTINRIRLNWDAIQNTSMSSNATSFASGGSATSVYVHGNQTGSILMKGESDESAWELEVSHTKRANRNSDNNDNATPIDDSDDTKPVPRPTPDLNPYFSRAPTKVFFEPRTSSPTQILNDYAFLSNHDTYLCSYNGSVGLQASPEQKQKTWTKISLGSEGKISLLSSEGTYLSAWWDSTIIMATHILGWEIWTEINNDDGTVSFKSYHGTYLAAWPDGMVRQSGQIHLWERFHEEAVDIE